jgi:hypothetical protein
MRIGTVQTQGHEVLHEYEHICAQTIAPCNNTLSVIFLLHNILWTSQRALQARARSTTTPVTLSQGGQQVLFRIIAVDPCPLPESLTLSCKQTNLVALVREQTIPTERPPLVDEVSANFYG